MEHHSHVKGATAVDYAEALAGMVRAGYGRQDSAKKNGSSLNTLLHADTTVMNLRKGLCPAKIWVGCHIYTTCIKSQKSFLL